MKEQEIIIIEENDEEWTEETEVEENVVDETDYKALYEQEKARWDKREGRFKKAKANENTAPKVNEEEIITKATSAVEEKLGAINFYSQNKEAMEHKEDIESLVGKWIDREKAYKYVMAEKNPEALLDEAKRNQLAGNTALNWVPAHQNPMQNVMNMSEEEISKLSDAEFDKLFPSASAPKKYFSQE